MAVASAGLAAYDALGRRQDFRILPQGQPDFATAVAERVEWAVERGLTNTPPLKSPGVLPAERRAQIDKTRVVADQAFREAAQRLGAVPEMKAAEKQVAEAESAFQAFEAFRSRVDDNLAKPGSGRASEVMEGFSPAITNMIELAANRLRLTLETLTNPPTVALTQLVGLRHLTALMARR